MEEKRFRDGIHWMTFLLSLLVVWVHSYNAELLAGGRDGFALADRLQRMVMDGLGQIAVPGFFMVSSYLFYRNFSWNRLPGKWKSRAKSVLAPYLLWNFLYYMAYVAATRLPFMEGLMGKEPVPFSLGELWQAVTHYAYNPVFWYLYQLILLILLAPVIYVVFRRTWTGIPALVLMLLGLWSNASLPFVNLDALFYYSGAAFFALHREDWGKVIEEGLGGRLFFKGENAADWRRIGRTAAAFGAVFCLVKLWEQPGGWLWGRALPIVAFRAWGVGVLWFVLSLVRLPEPARWMKNGFFLYAIHFLLVRLITKAAALILPPSPFFAMALFLFMPIFMTAAAEGLGRLARRVSPGLYRVLSGGR